MSKDRAKFLYVVLICLIHGLCNVGAVANGKGDFDSLINFANSSINILQALHSQVSVVLYNKFSQHVGSKLQEVVREDLTRIRTLISDSLNPNTRDCYTNSHLKISEIGIQAFIDMRPCNDIAVGIIQGYVSDLAHAIELARKITRGLETVQAICWPADNPEDCDIETSHAKTVVIILEDNIVAGLFDIRELGEKATLAGTAECFQEIYDNIRLKTREVAAEVEKCLRV